LISVHFMLQFLVYKRSSRGSVINEMACPVCNMDVIPRVIQPSQNRVDVPSYR